MIFFQLNFKYLETPTPVQLVKKIQFQAPKELKPSTTNAVIPVLHNDVAWPAAINKKAYHSSDTIENKPIKWPKPKILVQSQTAKRYPTMNSETTAADKRRITQKEGKGAIV